MQKAENRFVILSQAPLNIYHLKPTHRRHNKRSVSRFLQQLSLCINLSHVPFMPPPPPPPGADHRARRCHARAGASARRARAPPPPPPPPRVLETDTRCPRGNDRQRSASHVLVCSLFSYKIYFKLWICTMDATRESLYQFTVNTFCKLGY